MRRLALLPVLLAAACSSVVAPAPSTPADRGEAVPVPSSSALMQELALPTGGSVRLPSGWDAGSFIESGPGGWLATVGLLGTIDAIDLGAWEPAASPDARDAFMAILDDLASARALTSDGAAMLIAGNTEGLISETPGDVHAPKVLLHTDPEVIGIGYMSVRIADGDILSPGYIAYLYDRAANRLMRVSWALDPQEPLVLQANAVIEAASAETRSDVARSEAIAFARLLEETPRSRQSWGNALQTVDDLLLSYARGS